MLEDKESEWENVPTKQAKLRELQAKRQNKALEIQKRREQEQKEHDLKQKKINELFANTANAFSATTKSKSENRYNNPWGVLNDDGDGSDSINKSSNSSKKQDSTGQKVEEGGFLYTSKYINEQERKKQKHIQSQQKTAKKKQQQHSNQNKKQQLTIESASESFHYNKYYETMKTVEAKYPNVSDIQLKYVAECLEEYFGQIEFHPNEIINVLHENRSDFPLSHFDQKFIKETVKFLKSKQYSILPTITFLINTLISILKQERDALKSSGLGLLIFLQIVFKYLQDIPAKMLWYFKTVFDANTLQSLKPNIAALHLWLIIQTKSISAHVPLSFYYSVIFPLKLSPNVKIPASINELFDNFTQATLEELKNIKPESQISNDTIQTSVEQYIWSIQKNYKLDLTTIQFGEFLLNPSSLYPSKKVQSSYLEVLLSNTAIEDEEYRDKILETIINCLKLDSNCFDYIKKAYTKNVAQTNNLLLFITLRFQKDGGLKKSISSDSIFDLAKFCKESNDAILASKTKRKALSKNVSINDIEMCTVTCDSVLKYFKPSSPLAKSAKSMLGPIIMIPLVIASGFMARQMLCSSEHNDKMLQQLSGILCPK